jgi:HAD superfamily hydrolase (TIGR01509 family)
VIDGIDFRGALLDVDGTLIDSNDAHAQAWVEVLKRHGYESTFGDVRPLIGMGGDKVIPILTGLDADDERAQSLSHERRALFLSEYVPRLRAFDGALDFVDRLRDVGVTIVVATSAENEELEPMLRQTGLESLLERKTSSSDAEHSKPDPDIITAALRKGGLRPGDAVLVGDTPYDIAAAGNAGVRCIAVRAGGWWTDDELRGAVAIYDGPRELAAGVLRASRPTTSPSPRADAPRREPPATLR